MPFIPITHWHWSGFALVPLRQRSVQDLGVQRCDQGAGGMAISMGSTIHSRYENIADRYGMIWDIQFFILILLMNYSIYIYRDINVYKWYPRVTLVTTMGSLDIRIIFISGDAISSCCKKQCLHQESSTPMGPRSKNWCVLHFAVLQLHSDGLLAPQMCHMK